MLESLDSWKWGLFRGLDSRKWALFCVFGGIPPLGRNRRSETPEFDVFGVGLGRNGVFSGLLGSVWAVFGGLTPWFGPIRGV